MIGALKNAYNRALGRGDAAILMPVMDGPLKPNERLDAAERVAEVSAIDNLVADAGGLWATSDSQLGRVDINGFKALRRFSSAITSLAIHSGSRMAIGLDEGKVLIFDPIQGEITDQTEASCPTALLFWNSTHLLIASGSKRYSPSDWQADLISKGRSGSLLLWRSGENRPQNLVSGLAYPSGMIRDGENQLIFSEAWEHRLCAMVDPSSERYGKHVIEPVLSRLPGYPGGLSQNADGTAWLAMFAPRNQLVEFVLTDKEYRTRMMQEIDKPFWIAPSLRGGRSFHEPMQWGAVKQLGILKSWAPVFSYGLAVRLNEAFQPTESLHSRADGHVHGITSLVEQIGKDGPVVFAAAKGDGVLVKFRTGT